MSVTNAELRPLLEKALLSTRAASLVDDHPELVFTDGNEDITGETWRVQVLTEKEAAAYTGPFVIDRNHPLTVGLSLQGVVWGGGKSTDLAGAPVIMAGNVPLLTDTEGPSGRHDVRLRLRPDLSTLQQSPAWVVLISNVLQWHASLAPGLSRPNVRLGEDSVFTFAQPRGGASELPAQVEVVAPNGEARQVTVVDRRIVVRGEDTGTYAIRDPKARSVLARIAVNALARDESDLRQAVTARWGDWLDETTLRLEYQSVTWAVLLAVVVIFLIHLVLVSRGAS
jgi:hypothetical protein